MTDVHQEACPLCKIDSDFEYVAGDGEKRQRFYCVQCKKFVIADIAKRKLLGKGNRLVELSKLAASLNDDEVLHIYFEEREIKCRIVNL